MTFVKLLVKCDKRAVIVERKQARVPNTYTRLMLHERGVAGAHCTPQGRRCGGAIALRLGGLARPASSG